MKLVQFNFDTVVSDYYFVAGQVVAVEDDTDLTSWPVEVVTTASVFMVVPLPTQEE